MVTIQTGNTIIVLTGDFTIMEDIEGNIVLNTANLEYVIQRGASEEANKTLLELLDQEISRVKPGDNYRIDIPHLKHIAQLEK